MRSRRGGPGRSNFLDIFCARVAAKLASVARRTSIKSGNRVEIEARRIEETAVIGPPCSLVPSILSSLDLRGPDQSLIFSQIYLIIARLTTSSFTSEGDRVPTISRFHSAISTFRAPLRSKECPTGSARTGKRGLSVDRCFLFFNGLFFSPKNRTEREGEKKMRIGGLAIYPERIVAELEIWISNDALRGLTAP